MIKTLRLVCHMAEFFESLVGLLRIRDRGLKGRFNRKRKGRSNKLPRSLLKAVRKWLRRQPKEYGFESGS